jgi:hypothetical protein
MFPPQEYAFSVGLIELKYIVFAMTAMHVAFKWALKKRYEKDREKQRK